MFSGDSNDNSQKFSRSTLNVQHTFVVHFIAVVFPHDYGRTGVLRTDDFLRAKISWVHSLPNCLTHGAPLRALRDRESSAINWCSVRNP